MSWYKLLVFLLFVALVALVIVSNAEAAQDFSEQFASNAHTALTAIVSSLVTAVFAVPAITMSVGTKVGVYGEKLSSTEQRSIETDRKLVSHLESHARGEFYR